MTNNEKTKDVVVQCCCCRGDVRLEIDQSVAIFWVAARSERRVHLLI